MSGQTVSSPFDVYGVEAATSTKNGLRMTKKHLHQIAETASWVKEKNLIPLLRLQPREEGASAEKDA